jgi:hypothetical protein
MQRKSFGKYLPQAAVCAVLLLCTAGRTQNSHLPSMPNPLGEQPGFGQELPASARERQAKMQNEERQKRLVNDTEKLLALATQLHDDVAKSNKNILSIDVVKRADEIERLAHSIKDHMRS